MADVLIRGMEMPENCGKCDLICKAFSKWEGAEWTDKRHPDCPIVPLPAGHGRLIDADAFKAMCLSATKEAKPDFIRHEDWLKSCAITTAFCRDIDEQPTIVPAEGATDDVQKQRI